MNWHRELQCTAVSLVAAALWACAPAAPDRPRDAVLPEIDVLQMKENSDIALRMAQRNQQDIENLSTRVSELERAVIELGASLRTYPTARVEELQNQLTILREQVEALKVRTDSLPKTNLIRTTASRKGPEIVAPAPSDYQQALRLFDARDYSASAALFQKVAETTPETEWSDDSWYWIGECLYNRGDFQAASAAFQRVLSYLRTDKGDDAQFMLGRCFAQMGDRKRALTEFQKVEQLYPSSEYVARSRAEAKKNAGQ